MRKRRVQDSGFRIQGLALLVFFHLTFTPAEAAVFYPEVKTLSNGLQVVVVPGALSPAVAQAVWYKAGAADDPPGLSGLAHYLEHLMFKDNDYSEKVAAQGGSDNAFTDADATAYHVSVAAERLPLALALEAERMKTLSVSREGAESELSVVLSERQERTDNDPQGLFYEKLRAALFPDHPYGRPVIGWREDIEKLSLKDARAFHDAFYAPNNAILVVSGDVRPAEVFALAAETFGRLPARGGAKTGALPLPQAFIRARIEMKDGRVNQPFFVRLLVAPKNVHALEVLAEVLSGGEVGLLHRHFVLETKTASGIEASYDPTSRGPALFSLLGTPIPGGDTRKLEKNVEAYLRNLARTGLKAKDVEAAKRRLQDDALFARDRLMAPALVLGQALAVGQTIEDVEEWPDRIRAVTPREVNKALREILASPRQVQGVLEADGTEAK